MSVYDLRSVKLPVLMNNGLRALMVAAESPLTQTAIHKRLLKDAGYEEFRDGIAMHERPVCFPTVEAGDRGTPRRSPEELRSALDSVLTNERWMPLRTSRDFHRAYREGHVSPVEVAERVLAATAESDRGHRPLRAFIAQSRDDLLEQAKRSQERLQRGEPLSVLDGVPVAVKDELDMAPYPTTVGTSFLGRRRAQSDATVVARLRELGALLIGKANMHEIGMEPNGFNLHHGVTRNPYNRGHESGGSSSGPAAAVAAGLCPIAVGADGGGSIRIPAAHCGVVGLKGTFGRFSEHGAAPLCWSVAHVGPIGTSVEDVALAYLAMAGPDTADPATSAQGAVSIDGWDQSNLEGVRIGIFRPWFEHADPEIVSTCQALVGRLEARGARLSAIEIPDLELMRLAHGATIWTEMAHAMNEHREHIKEHAPHIRMNLSIAQAFTGRDYVLAQRVRARGLAIFEEVYESVDVVLTPTTGITAMPIPEHSLGVGWTDVSSTFEVMRFVVPGNLLGLPAISFPAGYTSAGLPVGMQAMAAHWNEALLLRVARVAEELVERRRPETYYDLI